MGTFFGRPWILSGTLYKSNGKIPVQPEEKSDFIRPLCEFWVVAFIEVLIIEIPSLLINFFATLAISEEKRQR